VNAWFVQELHGSAGHAMKVASGHQEALSHRLAGS
jgi:hypothetical protein